MMFGQAILASGRFEHAPMALRRVQDAATRNLDARDSTARVEGNGGCPRRSSYLSLIVLAVWQRNGARNSVSPSQNPGVRVWDHWLGDALTSDRNSRLWTVLLHHSRQLMLTLLRICESAPGGSLDWRWPRADFYPYHNEIAIGHIGIKCDSGAGIGGKGTVWGCRLHHAGRWNPGTFLMTNSNCWYQNAAKTRSNNALIVRPSK